MTYFFSSFLDKSKMYIVCTLVYHVLKLVMILFIVITTIARTFFVIKIVKTIFHNQIGVNESIIVS
jgi:hypothetical protein